jgi:hypothetical protein
MVIFNTSQWPVNVNILVAKFWVLQMSPKINNSDFQHRSVASECEHSSSEISGPSDEPQNKKMVIFNTDQWPENVNILVPKVWALQMRPKTKKKCTF